MNEEGWVQRRPHFAQELFLQAFLAQLCCVLPHRSMRRRTGTFCSICEPDKRDHRHEDRSEDEEAIAKGHDGGFPVDDLCDRSDGLGGGGGLIAPTGGENSSDGLESAKGG